MLWEKGKKKREGKGVGRVNEADIEIAGAAVITLLDFLRTSIRVWLLLFIYWLR